MKDRWSQDAKNGVDQETSNGKAEAEAEAEAVLGLFVRIGTLAMCILRQ
jgi:hypothetical protein